jgi:uncharacterized repeat protein (TIGR02543 family)
LGRKSDKASVKAGGRKMFKKHMKQLTALLLIIGMLTSQSVFDTVKISAEDGMTSASSAETTSSPEDVSPESSADSSVVAPELVSDDHTADSGKQTLTEIAAESKTTSTASVPDAADDSSTEKKTESQADSTAAVSKSSAAESTAAGTASTAVVLKEQQIHASIYTDASYAGALGDGTVITLTGTLSENSIVKAYPVDAVIEGQKILAAYDITIFTADGQSYEPTAGAVKVDISNATVKDAISANADLQVYHLDNIASQPEVVSDVKAADDKVSFPAQSFSIYAVTNPISHYTHTYNFKDANGTVYNTQILSAGETLKQPDTPTKAHAVFTGWTRDDGGSTDGLFTQAEGTLTTDETTNLTPVFEDRYYVHYMGEDKTSEVYSQEYTSGTATVNTSGVPFTTADVNNALIGWSTDPNATEATSSFTLNYNDLTLYPVIVAAHWITFDSKGGTSVNPVYVLSGKNTVAPSSDPTREGYVFAGWYDSETDEEFDFGTTISSNKSLYAKWNVGTTSMKVIYWQESLTEGKYDYVETSTISGITTGTTVSASDYLKSYDYFHYDATHSDQSKTVSADGSTVLNVKYARNSYKFEFDLNGGQRFGYATMTIGEKTYTNYGNKYSFTAKYGEDVASKWPTASNMDTVYGTDYSQKFEGWSGGSKDASLFSSKRWNVTKEMIETDVDGATQSYKGSWNDYLHSVTLHYWAQNTDDDDYTELTTYKQKANTSGGFSAKDIAGFVHDHDANTGWVSTGGDRGYYQVYNFYYNRLAYDLSFYNNSNTAEKVDSDIRFGKNISTYGYTPTVGTYYTFGGWYTTPDCLTGSEFSFDKATMPASNLALYAKWVKNQYTVTFDTQSEDAVAPAAQTVDADTCAVKPNDPTRTGYTFAGWTLTPTSDPYNFATHVVNNITLYAQWVKNTAVTVTYHINGGTSSVSGDPGTVTDSTRFTSVVVIQKPDAWTGPSSSGSSSWGFVCWNTSADGTGTNYYPDNYIDSSISDLYAIWAEQRTTTLRLNYNNDTTTDNFEDIVFKGAVKSDTQPSIPNTTYTLPSLDLTKYAPEGCELLGWNTAADGSGTAYSVGDNIDVDTLNSSTENILYAQWCSNLTVGKTVDGALGDTSKIFWFKIEVSGVTSKTYKIGTDSVTVQNSTQWISLQSGQTYTLNHLLRGAKYTISEVQAENSNEAFSSSGYTTKYAINKGDSVTATTTGEKTITMNPTTVTFTNTRPEAAPTALHSDVLPYILIVTIALSVGMYLLFESRRRKYRNGKSV